MKNNFRFICHGEIRYEFITRFLLSQIALSFSSFMLIILFSFLLINGCKKDDTSSPATTVTDVDGNIYHYYRSTYSNLDG